MASVKLTVLAVRLEFQSGSFEYTSSIRNLFTQKPMWKISLPPTTSGVIPLDFSFSWIARNSS
ncbi:hypothetical protein D3C75_989950 [compost metagenome]